jgi:hypothetical protein
MQATTPSSPTATPPTRRFGYAIAVAVNAALVWVVLNIQDWDVLPFLTDRFPEVVPWVVLSLAVSILANLVYQFDDSPPVRAFGDLVTSLIGAWVAYRVVAVFPFEFTGEGFDGSILIRVLLVLGIVGGAIGAVAALVRLIASSN